MEVGKVKIVRLLDVYIQNGYIYCTLYFFTKNKIITVTQSVNSKDYLWRIMENEEYDERMSRRLWQQVSKQFIS